MQRLIETRIAILRARMWKQFKETKAKMRKKPYIKPLNRFEFYGNGNGRKWNGKRWRF